MSQMIYIMIVRSMIMELVLTKFGKRKILKILMFLNAGKFRDPGKKYVRKCDSIYQKQRGVQPYNFLRFALRGVSYRFPCG